MGVIYSKLQGKPAPATDEDKPATKPTPKKKAKK